MARKPRHDHPGAWHHVYHRGARQAPVFKDDNDCTLFLRTLAETVEAFSLEVHAYALMPNHYHLLVRVPLGNLSRCMRHINGTYTQRYNQRHGWDGPLFRGRFGSELVSDPAHLTHLLAYIHLNPVKANLVVQPDAECWTSHRAYIGLDSTPEWLSTEFMVERHGGAAALHTFVLELHAGSQDWPEDVQVADSWWSPRRLLPAAQTPSRPSQQPLTVDATIARVRKITGLTEAEIVAVKRGRGGNPARRFMIWALRRGALSTHAAIGLRLGMSAGHVGRVLARFRAGGLGEPISGWQLEWHAGENV